MKYKISKKIKKSSIGKCKYVSIHIWNGISVGNINRLKNRIFFFFLREIKKEEEKIA